MRAGRTIAVIVASITLVSGCGGDGGGQTAAELRAQADELCAGSNERLRSIALPAEADASPASLAVAFEQSAEIQRELIADLAALPGAADDAAFSNLLVAADEVAGALERLAVAGRGQDVVASDAAFDDLAIASEDLVSRAQDYGLTECFVSGMQ